VDGVVSKLFHVVGGFEGFHGGSPFDGHKKTDTKVGRAGARGLEDRVAGVAQSGMVGMDTVWVKILWFCILCGI
jgi:hypothetical protein